MVFPVRLFCLAAERDILVLSEDLLANSMYLWIVASKICLYSYSKP
jgi:hypothetical protein